ncbi:MAG: mechanosensitive ion channel [Coriobacteriales bacterium]|nr:mechanosensitive ion channel [Coriobacteriales bacterium]
MEDTMNGVEETYNLLQKIATSDLLWGLLIAVIILVITAIVAHYARKLITKLLSRDGVELPSSSILINIAYTVIWASGIAFMLSFCFNVDINGLIAALGVGGIALSLGLQDTLKNLIGGLMVTILGIVQPGDHVIVGSVEGIVQDVTWRQTVVKDYENTIHLIPNATINSSGISKVEPSFIVSSTLVINNDGRDIDELLHEMEEKAKQAVEKIAPLAKDPWMLVTQIGELGIYVKMRFILEDNKFAREARDAALRAVAPYTRNNAKEMLHE